MKEWDTYKVTWALAMAALVAKTRVMSCILLALVGYFGITNGSRRMREC